MNGPDAPTSTSPTVGTSLPPDVVADPIIDVLADDDDVDLVGLGDRRIVHNFAEPQAEYAALHKACGLMPRADLGVVEAKGKDALNFLNNLLTNGLIDKETKTPMTIGTGCYSFFLNLRGRVVADMTVLRAEEDAVLLLTSRPFATVLAKSLDRYRFSEKVRFNVLSEALYVLSLLGPTRLDVLNDAADRSMKMPERPVGFPATSFVPLSQTSIGGVSVTALEHHAGELPATHLIVPTDRVLGVWNDLTTRFGETVDDRRYGQRRLRPVGWAMYNAVRIEHGVPLVGVDFEPAPPSVPGRKKDAAPEPKGGSLPAETGPLFDLAVSVTSGCYLGQEVVARMHARQARAKNLVGLKMSEDALPAAGVPVEIDEKEVGVVTSSTLSPVLSMAPIALATLKRPHFEIGTKVMVPAEGQRVEATVVDLPFVPVESQL
jgi:aminomethyltransferase